MISFQQLQSLFGKLALNSNADNLATSAQLMNIEQKYLLQKYFSNEGSFSISTVGQQTLAVTVLPMAGDTSAILTAPWPYWTTTAYGTFPSTLSTPNIQFTRNSTKITWAVPLSANATSTALNISGLQYYPAPPNYSKMKTVTITVGVLKWTPDEILSREDWDKLNVFPYYADIPKNFFPYPGGDHGVQIGIWPIPSTTGNTITYNYKFRIPDLSIVDYTTPGTVSVSQGSTTVTGLGTTFIPTTNPQLESRWIQFAQPTGDELWYQIDQVTSGTNINLYTPYQGISIVGSSAYTIGQMPIIMEDFHDMLYLSALKTYYTSVVDNKGKREQYQADYARKLELLNEYCDTKTVHVNLGRRLNVLNPNLFGASFG